MALAWQIAQPGITSPIASATSLKQLNELAVAANLSLSTEQVRVITDASAY
ncbi:MAG: aldo/keto reductase [Enterobacterales bacterium]|nr:aldo/keto reductase [Enterobacterales bacterium]